MIASPFLAWLIENLVWASAAMLLVLAIRRPVARAFGAGAAYALWLIPLCRLIAPPSEWVAAWFGSSLPALPPLVVLSGDGAGASAVAQGGLAQWVPVLIGLWIGGAAAFLALQALRYRRFLTTMSPTAHVGEHRGVALIESAPVDGPLALGLMRRRIVIPTDFTTRYSREEQRLALDHEAYHHRRRDIAANHLALAVLALNWCNPIAWFAFRSFRSDQELSCDAAIIAAASPAERRDYAHALVKSASPPGLVSACPLNSADQLKRRLKMLNRHRRDSRRLLAGSTIAISLAAVSLLAGSPGLAQDKAEPKQERRSIIIMERHDGAAGNSAPTTERREIRLRRDADGNVTTEGGDPELARHLEGCRDSSNQLVNVDEGSGGEHTRVILCAQGDGSAAGNVEALERARERISGETHLSAETKQRILAEIDRAIARARGN